MQARLRGGLTRSAAAPLGWVPGTAVRVRPCRAACPDPPCLRRVPGRAPRGRGTRADWTFLPSRSRGRASGSQRQTGWKPPPQSTCPCWLSGPDPSLRGCSAACPLACRSACVISGPRERARGSRGKTGTAGAMHRVRRCPDGVLCGAGREATARPRPRSLPLSSARSRTTSQAAISRSQRSSPLITCPNFARRCRKMSLLSASTSRAVVCAPPFVPHCFDLARGESRVDSSSQARSSRLPGVCRFLCALGRMGDALWSILPR